MQLNRLPASSAQLVVRINRSSRYQLGQRTMAAYGMSLFTDSYLWILLTAWDVSS